MSGFSMHWLALWLAVAAVHRGTHAVLSHGVCFSDCEMHFCWHHC